MDRESFDVSVDASGDGWPLLTIDVAATAGAASDVDARLSSPDGVALPAADVDVTYRETAGERAGVLALSNRLTGEFVLEAPAESGRIAALVEAVIETDGADAGHYRLAVTTADGSTTTYEKETLLVYDAEGNLLRARSLIPGGVEL